MIPQWLQHVFELWHRTHTPIPPVDVSTEEEREQFRRERERLRRRADVVKAQLRARGGRNG